MRESFISRAITTGRDSGIRGAVAMSKRDGGGDGGQEGLGAKEVRHAAISCLRTASNVCTPVSRPAHRFPVQVLCME
jgi:hypothetical protein